MKNLRRLRIRLSSDEKQITFKWFKILSVFVSLHFIPFLLHFVNVILLKLTIAYIMRYTHSKIHE